jgi:hypothetical protein
LKLLTPIQLSYIAGIVDGEGSISVYQHKKRRGKEYLDYTYGLHVSVTNTYKPVVDWLQKKTGLGSIGSKLRDKENYKTAYTWVLQVNQIQPFLEALLPYLIIKHAQAELMLEFLTKCTSTSNMPLTESAKQLRRIICLEMAELNRQGK